jgi:hypothetical protein
MKNTLPLSVLILAHRFDQKLFNAVQRASFAAEVLIGWNGDDQLSPNDHNTLKQKHHHIRISIIPGKITDFAATRNALHEKATQSWILWIDSDEVLAEDSEVLLEKLLSRDDIAGASLKT